MFVEICRNLSKNKACILEIYGVICSQMIYLEAQGGPRRAARLARI